MTKKKTIPAVSDDTMEQWRREMERSRGKPADEGNGLSALEIAAGLSVSISTAKRMIRDGLTEGRYTKGPGARKTTAGYYRACPVYRINPDFKEA